MVIDIPPFAQASGRNSVLPPPERGSVTRGAPLEKPCSKTVSTSPGHRSAAARGPALRGRAGGFLMIDLIVGMALLVLAIMPLAYTVNSENQLFRATYQRAVAMEIVDGEVEILAAGEWQSISEGTHEYTVQAHAAANLPPGQFQITRTGKHLRLEWTASEKHGIGTVVREVTVK